MMTDEAPRQRWEIVPPPGSDKALDAGCRCPVMDNGHGRGRGNPPEFWVSEDCPMHGKGYAVDGPQGPDGIDPGHSVDGIDPGHSVDGPQGRRA